MFLAGYRSEGIPSEEALLSLYCKLTGHTLPLPNWTYFLALVLFRLIVNIQVSGLTDVPGLSFGKYCFAN